MPTLRLFAEDAFALGSAGRTDTAGNPCFPVAPGSDAMLTVDATGWLGSSAESDTDWDTDLTLASSGQNTARTVSYALLTIPGVFSAVPSDAYPTQYRVTHTVRAADGRSRVTQIYLVA